MFSFLLTPTRLNPRLAKTICAKFRNLSFFISQDRDFSLKLPIHRVCLDLHLLKPHSRFPDQVMAIARPNTINILKYDMIGQFKRFNIKTIINLQKPGEHPYCGHGLVDSAGTEEGSHARLVALYCSTLLSDPRPALFSCGFATLLVGGSVASSVHPSTLPRLASRSV